MTDSKHTPGPWRTDENGHIVCYPDGLSIGVLSKQLPEGELKANHQLIVAAPELLEALKAINVDVCMASASSENMRLVRDAIAKATP
jgi:beta-phosphoglucomutase-like phosphatase (HAD superfamily)